MKIGKSIEGLAARLGKSARLAPYVLLLLFSPQAHADIANKNDIVKVICNIASYMFWVLVSLSTVMVLAAAFRYLTAGDNAENVKKAHKTIAFAAAAIVVALLAKGFPGLIAIIVGVSDVSGCQ